MRLDNYLIIDKVDKPSEEVIKFNKSILEIRERETAIRIKWFKEFTKAVFTVFFIAGFFGFAFSALFGFVDIQSSITVSLLSTILIVIQGVLIPIMGFHFMNKPIKPDENSIDALKEINSTQRML